MIGECMGDSNTDPPQPDEQPTLFSAEMQHCDTMEVSTVVYIMPEETELNTETLMQFVQDVANETQSMPLTFMVSKGDTIIVRGGTQ